MKILLLLLLLSAGSWAQKGQIVVSASAPTNDDFTGVSVGWSAGAAWYWYETGLERFNKCTSNPCVWEAVDVVPHAHNLSFACGSTDKLRGFDAAGVPICAADAQGSGSGATALRVASSDYTNSTTSYTDVSGLTLAVTVGTYNVNCDLIVSAAATTTGIQVALNGPANSFLRYHSEYFTSATAKAVWSSTTYDPTTAANGTLPAASGGTVITAYKLNGQIVATGSGTIAVRAKSEIAASAITIYRGSSCSIF